MQLTHLMTKARRVYPWLPNSLPTQPVFAEPLENMFNPSMIQVVAARQPDVLSFVCRQHYFDIDKRGIMIGAPKFEKSINWLHRAVRTGDQFRIVKSEPMPVFNGIEDLRFYKFGNRLYVTGTRPDFAEGKLSYPFVASALDIGAATTEADLRHFELAPRLAPIEKNWVYFSDNGQLYLERLPGMKEYYSLDIAAERLAYHRHAAEPFVWSGTKSVRWRGGNLFLDHKRMYPMQGLATVMRFVYRFRFHAAGMGPAVLSREFSLMRETPTPVYASDMAIDEQSILIGVGIGERVSQILRTPLSVVARMLEM